MTLQIPPAWHEALAKEQQQDYFLDLESFVEKERSTYDVFPPKDLTFAALQAVVPADIRVVILGQDPYHGPGQAHGLSFSVAEGVKLPPSLKNIFKELHSDLGCPMPGSGCLQPWAEQGVLLLNTVLTVRSGEANSHRKKGWERFTDQVISRVNEQPLPIAFVLWGRPAQLKRKLITSDEHLVIESPHPSPLSAHNGFFGSRPFSRINQFLTDSRRTPIQWAIKP
jgi:uracil-DNA glycosylase